ncbi:glutaredoxin family protein [Psychrobacter immobilis]|uniref:glutaredoxin family protein n=1 Tax=Psychrobacter immobilis TaxID=498 RepID=UPI003FD0E3F4
MYDDNNIKALRERMVAANPDLGHAENNDKWWLLGTSGCHLCDIAAQLLTQFQAVQPIAYQQVDIAHFDEPLMMEFATTIPVILTPSTRLNYPFSVMDLQQLFIQS